MCYLHFYSDGGKTFLHFLLGKGGGEGVQLSMNHSSTPNRRKCPRQLIQMNYLSFSKALLVIFFIASPPAEMFTAVLNVATGCRLSTPVSDRWRHPKSRPPSRLKSADRALWVSHLVLMQLTNRDVSPPRRWRHRPLPTPLPPIHAPSSSSSSSPFPDRMSQAACDSPRRRNHTFSLNLHAVQTLTKMFQKYSNRLQCPDNLHKIQQGPKFNPSADYCLWNWPFGAALSWRVNRSSAFHFLHFVFCFIFTFHFLLWNKLLSRGKWLEKMALNVRATTSSWTASKKKNWKISFNYKRGISDINWQAIHQRLRYEEIWNLMNQSKCFPSDVVIVDPGTR